MLTMYPACFYKEEDGYSVVFPDLENGYLGTCGKDLEEAVAMAIDCLAGYIHLSWELNDEIPPASPLNEIDVKEHFEKSVKKTLTIPSWLNDLAIENNINFSQVLQEALLTKLRA